MSTQLPTAVPAGLWLEERGAEYVVHDHAHHHEAHELVLRSQTLPELKRTPRDQPARRRAYPSRSSPAGAQRGPGRARRGRASARAALSLGPDLDICARPTVSSSLAVTAATERTEDEGRELSPGGAAAGGHTFGDEALGSVRHVGAEQPGLQRRWGVLATRARAYLLHRAAFTHRTLNH
jgi:hypothetical protein